MGWLWYWSWPERKHLDYNWARIEPELNLMCAFVGYCLLCIMTFIHELGFSWANLNSKFLNLLRRSGLSCKHRSIWWNMKVDYDLLVSANTLAYNSTLHENIGKGMGVCRIQHYNKLDFISYFTLRCLAEILWNLMTSLLRPSLCWHMHDIWYTFWFIINWKK